MTLAQERIINAFRLISGHNYDPKTEDRNTIHPYIFLMQTHGIPVTDFTFQKYKDGIKSGDLERALIFIDQNPDILNEKVSKEIIYTESQIEIIKNLQKYIEMRPNNLTISEFLDLICLILYLKIYETEKTQNEDEFISLLQTFHIIDDKDIIHLVLYTINLIRIPLTTEKVRNAINWINNQKSEIKDSLQIRTLRATAYYFLTQKERTN